MKQCRECGHQVSADAVACPGCGAPYPARETWDGWGFEYRSGFRIGGMPFIHVSFKYRPNRRPVPACGVIAVGQFAAGIVAIGQFATGLVAVGQFAMGLWTLAQIGAGWSVLAQISFYLHDGVGQVVIPLLGGG